MGNVAAVAGVVARALRDVPVVAVAPAGWNGGRRKGTWDKAVLEWGGVVVDGPEGLKHNARDALAILMWWQLGAGVSGSLARLVG